MKPLPKEFQFKCDEHSLEQCEKLGIMPFHFEANKIGYMYHVSNGIICGETESYFVDDKFDRINIINLSDYLEEEVTKPSINYPILGYAPGHYSCNCTICKNKFQGDKRAVMCEVCAINELNKLSISNSKTTTDHSELIVELTGKFVAAQIERTGMSGLTDKDFNACINTAEETVKQLKERGYLK